MPSLFRDHPPAFSLIFMLEFWERFGFYTVQGILALFFIRHLGFSEVQSYYTFGAFSALVYSMLSIGGFLGDKVLGTKRTIVLGLLVLASGYTALAFVSKEKVFFALGLICVGNGLFKANPSNLLSKCYGPRDPRLHSAFTLYYMAINLGSIFALFVGPNVSSHYGYSCAYLIAAIGLLLGLANFLFQKKRLANLRTWADERPVHPVLWILVLSGILLLTLCASYLLQHVHTAKTILWCIVAVVLFFYFLSISREPQKAAQIKMLVAFVLMLEAVLFFTLYQQMPTSLNLFAVNHVYPTLFGVQVDPQTFQVLNALWIVSMSPVLAYFYSAANQQKFRFEIPHKFALGMTMCGIGFLSLYFSRYCFTGNGMVSSWWLVLSYFFQSLGELLVSALGVAMVAELVPGRIAGFVMGMWFLTSAMAGFLGAQVASYTALPKNMSPGVDSLFLYTKVFGLIGLTTLFIALLMWLLAPRLQHYMDN
jgi:POT family proton-dependent oligopeptide transporter